MQKEGNEKYARPMREPVNNPVTNAANSGAKPNRLKVDEEIWSIPIKG
jgi:ribosomal protein L22